MTLDEARERVRDAKRELTAAQREFRRLGGRSRRRPAPAAPSPEWDRAAIERRIRRERAHDLSLKAIADGLNEDGVPTPRGRLWYAASVANILNREERL